MPFVMLKKDWPATFRRTIGPPKDRRQMEFTPGVPVDLTAAEVDMLRADIGIALMPVDFDEKARPRVITDDVIADEPPAVVQPISAAKPSKKGKATSNEPEPSN
jgi:hypothetical protein